MARASDAQRLGEASGARGEAPQFREPRRASREDLRSGIDRVFIGLFMIALARVVGGGLRPGAICAAKQQPPAGPPAPL